MILNKETVNQLYQLVSSYLYANEYSREEEPQLYEVTDLLVNAMMNSKQVTLEN